MRDNPAILEELRKIWLKENKGKKKKSGEVTVSPEKAATIKTDIAAKAPKGKTDAFAILLEQLTAQTDCGACGYPTCRDYTDAMAGGADMDPSKCEPGGAEATADLGYAMDVYWKSPTEADKIAFGDAAPAAAPAADAAAAPAPAADAAPAE